MDYTTLYFELQGFLIFQVPYFKLIARFLSSHLASCTPSALGLTRHHARCFTTDMHVSSWSILLSTNDWVRANRSKTRTLNFDRLIRPPFPYLWPVLRFIAIAVDIHVPNRYELSPIDATTSDRAPELRARDFRSVAGRVLSVLLRIFSPGSSCRRGIRECLFGGSLRKNSRMGVETKKQLFDYVAVVVRQILWIENCKNSELSSYFSRAMRAWKTYSCSEDWLAPQSLKFVSTQSFIFKCGLENRQVNCLEAHSLRGSLVDARADKAVGRSLIWRRSHFWRW